MAKWFPGRKLSWVRLTAVIMTVLLVAGGGWWSWLTWQDRQVAAERTPWTDAYVDVTATPSFPFEAEETTGPANATLAFIVASESNACIPSWGGYYSLEEAASELDLDRRIARLVDRGGSVMVSFGGQLGPSMALNCTNVDALASGYRTVVNRYNLTSIDMDIEGEMLENEAAVKRQAQAVAALQESRWASGEGLDVWMTLPVSQRGLSHWGEIAVREYLAAGVDIAGVNAMTMNLGLRAQGAQMSQAARDSLNGLHAQLNRLYAEAEMPLGSATLWSKIAATPMIGQNDLRDEVFTLEDAKRLRDFADERGMVRLSMWSWNRDRSCGANWPDPRVVSDSCSGIAQGDDKFYDILSMDRDGTIVNAQTPTEPEEPMPVPVDDPETSPYPVWNDETPYPEGSRVVWRQNVYIANWWNEGSQPDDPALNGGEIPWRLLGPVMPGETPVAPPELPADAFPAWAKETVYEKGDRVIFDGTGYEARWWTQGDSPDASSVVPDASPWRPLTVDEIRQVTAD